MYKNHTQCRVCGSTAMIEVFNLGVQPLANDFTLHDQESQGFAPLKVLHCEPCALSQLSVVVNPDVLYANYPYVTSTSQMMVDHFERVISMLKKRPHERLIEIGSNDGRFLKYCQKNGIENVVGIDPASNLAKDATDSGVDTVVGKFNSYSSRKVGIADIVVARHVFCHIDDWHDFIRNLFTCTHEESTVFIEVPYLMDMLDRVEFDTIYHEHTSYLSIRSIVKLLEDTPWFLEKVERFSIHGGAVGLFLRRRLNGPPSDPIVGKMLALEDGIVDGWESFNQKAYERINRLRDVVLGFNNAGGAVCGFGASAKSTVWINACGFTKDDIMFICDCTPQKIGRLSPGTDIPVFSEERLEEASHAVLWAWNYKDEILARKTTFRENGGLFIIPIPELSIA